MGLFDLFKPKMPNGVNSNSINKETGMTFYQQSMTLLGHCLVLISQVERKIDSITLNEASQIQLLFSRNIMQLNMEIAELKDIMIDFNAALEEMPEEDFIYYNNEGISEISLGLPSEVKNEIIVFLALFHLISKKSSKSQVEAIEHIQCMIFSDSLEYNIYDIMNLARKRIEIYNL